MCFSTLPFTKIPRRMTVELVYLQIFWLNFYIPLKYTSDTMGPGAIVSGHIYGYNILCGRGI